MTPQNVLKAGTVLLGLLLAASQAHAISRYNSTSMSCADIGAVVRAEGAVVLRWKQPPDIQRFDRFVAHTGFCSWGERAVRSSVPSADHRSCTVYNCKRCDPDDIFGFFSPFRCR